MHYILFIFLILAIVGYIAYKKQNSKNQDNYVADYLGSIFKPGTKFVASDTIDKPKSFGYKLLWFAVKNASKQEIINLLELSALGQSNWANGVNQAYDNRIFVTPEIEGWTLVCGNGLLHKLDKENEDVELLNKLSSKFGEAQYFYTHRVTEYHIWAKSINGKLERYYSYIGEQSENLKIEGNPTEVEKGKKLVNTFSEDAKKDTYFEDETLVTPDEELVMEIAEDWSINPTEIEKYTNFKNEYGIVCEIK